MSFSTSLYRWHSSIDRQLPWKTTDDPFFIWLSEIILQQTRVEQGIPYFLKFRDQYANVHELAAASDEELMKLWQGLGYYSRARNLHKAAKQIVKNGGQFPDNYEGLLELPGVGPYTAAAIASFAYNLPTPVIDGNVTRVISRIFGITEGIDTRAGKRMIIEKLHSVFDATNPAKFNQAIMDFGALQCTPKRPDCRICPFSDGCLAYANRLVEEIPIKIKKVKKSKKTIHYAIIQEHQQLLIKKRVQKGIWQHLHDFPELDKHLRIIDDNGLDLEGKQIKVDGPFKHVLTHLDLKIYFHVIEAQELKLKNGSPYFLVERKNLQKFAFPKIIDWYLTEKSIY
ncbi:A/G-specific adenine glycosylase [Portibacter marinus]|uniref:A/G-specific adenine glycosylase n=1 Tax=Portibacter marinus TaxID=2898660 RepID=UPI001F226A70|nr:A/G-specific adenine glycosylase [Portibacter marinus]